MSSAQWLSDWHIGSMLWQSLVVEFCDLDGFFVVCLAIS